MKIDCSYIAVLFITVLFCLMTILFLQESQVSVDCVIPQMYHRTVMGTRGANVQDICKTYDVGIKFPDRPVANGGKNALFIIGYFLSLH